MHGLEAFLQNNRTHLCRCPGAGCIKGVQLKGWISQKYKTSLHVV